MRSWPSTGGLNTSWNGSRRSRRATSVSLESWTFGCETRGLLQREAARDFTSEKNKFMNIPSVEPLYTTSLEEVFWGVILVGITKTLHGLPALPFLLSAGALAATGKFNPFLGIGVT